MGLNPLLLLLASILLLTLRVSSMDEELNLAKAASPVKEPTPVAPSLPPPVPVKPTPPTRAFPPLPYIPVTPPPLDCDLLCGGRCKFHPNKKLCKKACITCCEKCKCVPPGTYGNREKCGKCYTDARPKCP